MKTKNKALLLTLCAVLLVAASVLGTMAYLTDTKEVKNTFTVGSVAIKLDETKTNLDGTPVTGDDAGRTETGNKYKLLPGQSYTKDPMVTVKSGSEDSWVFMTVTVSKSSELDKIFDDHKATEDKAADFTITDVVLGYDNNKWTYVNNAENTTANTRTYLFAYNGTADGYKDGVAADEALPVLFTKIDVPDELSNTEIATIGDMTITVNGYAIQVAGFDTAADAWGEFETTAGVSYPKAQA